MVPPPQPPSLFFIIIFTFSSIALLPVWLMATLHYLAFENLFKEHGAIGAITVLLNCAAVERRRVCAGIWSCLSLNVCLLLAICFEHAPSLLVCGCCAWRLCNMVGCVVWCGCVWERHVGPCCWALWRHVKGCLPLFPIPWLALDWWGRCCLCSLIHHTLYLGFRGKEKGKKVRIKENETYKNIRVGGWGVEGRGVE